DADAVGSKRVVLREPREVGHDSRQVQRGNQDQYLWRCTEPSGRDGKFRQQLRDTGAVQGRRRSIGLGDRDGEQVLTDDGGQRFKPLTGGYLNGAITRWSDNRGMGHDRGRTASI